MNRILILFSFLVLFIFAVPANSTTINVNVSNYTFSILSFDAVIGDTVKWTLVDGVHTTTSTSVPLGAATWDYTFTGAGDSFIYVIAVAGVYEYYCSIHPSMVGSFSTSVPLPFSEEFDFAATENITMHGWVAHSAGGTNPITINSGGLTFAGYPSSGIGNAALLFGNSEDDHRLFDSQTTDSVYMAFMINVTDNPNGYFLHFATNPYGFDYRGRIYLQGTNPDLEFGLAFSTETAVATANNYVLGTTYLIVLKYTINAGANNDEVSLYVFDGAFPTTEPAVPNIGPLTNAGATDINPGSVSFRKFNAAQNLIVDGIRIGTTWGDVVPVELTSFTATVVNNSVELKWSTATELNNSGFEVQKSTQKNEWENIGFVQGNGTVTEITNYSFTEKNLVSGNYSYRLKQIDFDGTFKYSNVVEADVVNPSRYELSQNYPNPFNPNTSINFAIPEAANVTIKVFNLLGEEVATLINKNMETGNHTVNFDAGGLNSGLYLYRIEAGKFTQVKKMTLLK